MQTGSALPDSRSKLRLYAAITAALIVVALASYLIVPDQSTVKGCMGLAITNSRYACISNIAIVSSNASICGSLPAGQYADDCYAQVAHKTGVGNDCMQIGNSSARSACVTGIAVPAKNYSLCGSADEPYASRCEEKVALLLYDGSLCRGISEATYRDACSSITDIRLAITSNDFSHCRNVSDSHDKNFTNNIIGNFSYGALPGYEVNSTAMLGSISFLPNTTYTPRDFCYSVLAYKSGNFSLCSSVSAGTARDLCAYRSTTFSSNSTANYTQQLQGCDNAGAYRQSCITSLTISEAVKTMNSTMCGRIDTQSGVTCFTLLASTYKNSTYCGYISDSSQRSMCLSGSQ
jgi:hypothetical protein